VIDHVLAVTNEPRPARRPSLRRALLLRLLSLTLGSLAALCLLEVGLRIVGYAGAEERAQSRFDARYGTVRKDSWIFDFQIDPRRHRAVELRGQHIELQKPAGQRRVLFVGDSATEGAFVPIEASYPLRFQQLLDARDPENRVRVINAGVWGMTTIDEYHLLRDKLLPLQPDVVIVGVFMANDINFNLAHGRKQLRLQAPAWSHWVRQHSALGHMLFLRALSFNARHRWLGPETLGARWVPAPLSRVDARGLHMLSYPAGELALYLRKPSALVDEAYDVMEQVLGDFIALGRQHGFSVRLLLIPTPSSVVGRLAILHHPEILTTLREQGIEVDASELDFGLPTRRMLALCQKLELPCVDARPAMKRLGLAAFFRGDEHPNEAGHRILAKALLAP